MTSQKDNSCVKWQKKHKTKNNFKTMSSFLNEGSRGREKQKTLKFFQVSQLEITLNSLMIVQSVKRNRYKQ